MGSKVNIKANMIYFTNRFWFSVQTVLIAAFYNSAVFATELTLNSVIDKPNVQWTQTVSTSVRALSFSPDDSLLATVGEVNIVLWNAATGEVAKRLGSHHTDSGAAVAFSPDGESVVFGQIGGPTFNLNVFQVVDGLLRFGRLKGIFNGSNAVAHSSDGQWVATGGRHVTQVRKASDMSVKYAINGGGTVRSIAFSPDNSVFAAGYDSGTIVIRRTLDGASVAALQSKQPDYPYTLSISALQFSPDNKLLATSSLEGIRIWNVATQTLQREIKLNLYASSLSFSPNGETLLATNSYWKYPYNSSIPATASLGFWRVADGSLIKKYEFVESGYMRAAYSHDGQSFAFSSDGTVAVAAAPKRVD